MLFISPTNILFPQYVSKIRQLSFLRFHIHLMGLHIKLGALITFGGVILAVVLSRFSTVRVRKRLFMLSRLKVATKLTPII